MGTAQSDREQRESRNARVAARVRAIRQLLLREGVPMRGERVDLGRARLPPEL
jgi:hypothetical protein